MFKLKQDFSNQTNISVISFLENQDSTNLMITLQFTEQAFRHLESSFDEVIESIYQFLSPTLDVASDCCFVMTC